MGVTGGLGGGGGGVLCLPNPLLLSLVTKIKVNRSWFIAHVALLLFLANGLQTAPVQS